jgi:hypothetical protein
MRVRASSRVYWSWETLGGGISDPVVVEGLQTLTDIINVTTLYANAVGRDRASELLSTLHDRGHAVDPESAREWAMARGWSARAAGQLADLAQQISAGKRLRIKRPALRADILEGGVTLPVSEIRSRKVDPSGASALPVRSGFVSRWRWCSRHFCRRSLRRTPHWSRARGRRGG